MLSEKPENYLREIIFITFVQKKIIVFTTICLFVISVLIAFLWPPTYSAGGSILLRGKKLEKSPEALEQINMRSTEVTKEDLAAEVEILRSPALIARAIKSLQEKGQYPTSAKPIPLNKEIHSIRKYSLETILEPMSNIIKITYFSKDKDYAVDFLQVLMDEYLQSRLKMYHPKQTASFYSGQANKFRDELKEKEDELIAMVEVSRSADPLKELQKDMDLRVQLEPILIKLKADVVDRELFIQQLNKGLKSKKMTFFSFVKNDLILSMSIGLQTILQEQGNLRRIYTKESKQFQLIEEQLKRSYSALLHEVRSYRDNELKKLEILTTNIEMLGAKINNIIIEDVELKKELIRQQSIVREITLRENSYDTFSKRNEETLSAQSGGLPSLVSILNRAFPSNGAIYPKKRVVIPLGLAVGMLMGFSLGFLRYYFDHTFKKPNDVENIAGLCVLFSIPLYDDLSEAPESSSQYLISGSALGSTSGPGPSLDLGPSLDTTLTPENILKPLSKPPTQKSILLPISILLIIACILVFISQRNSYQPDVKAVDDYSEPLK